MTATVQSVLEAAEGLSAAEQLEVIAALSRSLQRRYEQGAPVVAPDRDRADTIPVWVKRTAPLTDPSRLVADFWPEDETADDINNFIAQQRAEDLRHKDWWDEE